MRIGSSFGSALTGLLLNSAAVSAAPSPSSVSGPARTPAPTIPHVKAIQPTSCAEYTTYSTNAASVSCWKLEKKQNIIPHTCSTYPGMVTECVKHYVGGHPYTPPPNTYKGGQITVTDVSSSIGEKSPTTFAVVTTSADISLSIPTKPADFNPSTDSAAWFFALTPALLGKISGASEMVCPKGKRIRRNTIALPADRIETFRKAVQNIVSESSVNVPEELDITDALRQNAWEVRAGDIVELEPILGADAGGKELAAAVASIGRVGQLEGMSATVADAITESVMKKAAAALLAEGVFVEAAVLLKTMVQKEAEKKGRLPKSSATKTTTSSSSTTDSCAMCTNSAACYVDPDDPQGEDGDPPNVSLRPVVIPICKLLDTKPAKCQCPDGRDYKTSSAAIELVGITTGSKHTSKSTTACPYTKQPTSGDLIVTAPITKGHSTPTFVPTATPTCPPREGPSWRQKFVQDKVRSFCNQAQSQNFKADSSNPLWKRETYWGLKDSLSENQDLAIYIHYEQAACPASNKDKSYTLTSDSCYDAFKWLWVEDVGCLSKPHAQSGPDAGSELWQSGGGYYKDCMWWELGPAGTTHKPPPPPPPSPITPVGPYKYTRPTCTAPPSGKLLPREIMTNSMTKFCNEMSKSKISWNSVAATATPTTTLELWTIKLTPTGQKFGWLEATPKAVTYAAPQPSCDGQCPKWKFSVQVDQKYLGAGQWGKGGVVDFGDKEWCLKWMIKAVDDCPFYYGDSGPYANHRFKKGGHLYADGVRWGIAAV
ncbi:hypothetical protein Slin15195_G036960 [Septoria linicola]|uniref:Uncharacterized protein n=1 Tax=Septoria linicola TaxID=215465 RepID=A0A9Q9AJA5_9PEZI|nr:hypothetical protein Slin15195_G036960 [Septoria linicola]